MSRLPEDGESEPIKDLLLEGTACTPLDFTFEDGVFYALYDGYRHPRMNAIELYENLKDNPPSPVMPDGTRKRALIKRRNNHWHALYQPHFYSAQLLHYGLQPVKSKTSAKERLLAAFGGPDGKTLEVPPAIFQLEEKLRAQWHVSNPRRKASQTPRREFEGPIVVPQMKQPATQMGLPSSSTLRPLQLEPIPTSSTEQFFSTRFPNFNRITTPPPTPQLFKAKEKVRKRRTPIRSPATPIEERSSSDRELSSPEFRTEKTDVRDRGRLASVISREMMQIMNKEESTPEMTKDDMRAAIESLTVDRARQILLAVLDGPPDGQKTIAKELSAEKSTATTSKLAEAADPPEWTGLYDIRSPSIKRKHGNKLNCTFEVYTSSTSSHLWAHFDFGFVWGVMRSVYAPPKLFDAKVYFEWRGRDSSENSMMLDRDNRSIITFRPGGLLEGKVCAGRYGTIKIYGSIKVIVTLKTQDQQRKVALWKDKWRSFNSYNHNVERTGTWGRWEGTMREEEAFESDTTSGRKKRSWEIDVENFMGGFDTESDL